MGLPFCSCRSAVDQLVGVGGLQNLCDPNAEIIVNDDHIANAREMFVHLQHPVIGDMIVPGNPVKLMDTKPEITKCAPDLGQDTKEIYEGVLGLSDADLAKLKEEKVI